MFALAAVLAGDVLDPLLDRFAADFLDLTRLLLAIFAELLSVDRGAEESQTGQKAADNREAHGLTFAMDRFPVSKLPGTVVPSNDK